MCQVASSLHHFSANPVYLHFFLPSNSHSGALPSFGHDWQLGSLAEGVSSCFSIYSVNSRHPWLPLLLWGVLCATRRRLTTENDSRSNHSRLTACDLFFQLACKLGSGNYCLLVVCVCVCACERNSVRERETDSCLKFTALSKPQVRPCSNFNCSFCCVGCLMFRSRRHRVHTSSHPGLLQRCALCKDQLVQLWEKRQFAMNRSRGEITRRGEHDVMQVCVIV